MSQNVYIDQIFQPIFQPIVKLLIKAYYNFVLKEDGDLGYGLGKSNIIHI